MHIPTRRVAAAGSTVLFMAAMLGPSPVAGASATWLFNSATGHYYSQVNGLTWADSEAFAVARGGHLVTINNQAEQEWLAAYFPQENLWIGFNDRATEGAWVWSSGQSSKYTDWSPGEPNDYNGFVPSGEDAAVTNWQKYQPGNSGWNDYPENTGCWTDPEVDCAARGGMAGIIEVPRLPQSGTVGAYSLNDTSAGPGVKAIYRYVSKYDTWKLGKIVVRAPNMSAVIGKTAQKVGWKFTIQRRFCSFGHCSGWTNRYTSPVFKAVTNDATNAAFSDESVAVRPGPFGYDGGYGYRAIVKMFWYRPSGSVQGTAKVGIYYYRLAMGATTEVTTKDCPAFY